jgi:hypothetical protein
VCLLIMTDLVVAAATADAVFYVSMHNSSFDSCTFPHTSCLLCVTFIRDIGICFDVNTQIPSRACAGNRCVVDTICGA